MKLPPCKGLFIVAVLLFIGPLRAAIADKQLEELQQLRQVLPPCRGFDQWLETFACLPPDFDTLPMLPYPQDLLSITENGRQRRITAAEWPTRRRELAD